MMTYNHNPNVASSNNSSFPAPSLSTPGSGFGSRASRFNAKRLSVALPPDAAPTGEHTVGGPPTPRTSRSHLLSGLRTQPKTQAVPASAPYYQTQHQISGLAASQWADPAYLAYQQQQQQRQAMPQTATAATFQHHPQQYAMRAGQQMYALPEQVLAPPSVYDQTEGMDPSLLQQLQMTSMFLAQRQQQLQQKLAALSVPGQMPSTPQTPQNMYAQQQTQAPIEVQPGVYLVYNPATQGYSYTYDQNAQLLQHTLAQQQQQQQQQQQGLAQHFEQLAMDSRTPAVERARSFTPPSKVPTPPSALEHVEPLPPPSANAFRRGHKKATSLAINPSLTALDGPKTASAASFGSQRAFLPQPPMTGTFGPGAARAGEHPMRQPRGPPPLEELTVAPTSKHENSKNFATRQRRRALDNLMRAGTQRRGVSRSSGGSPVSERDYNFAIPEDVLGEELASVSSSAIASRKMSPIGHEMKQKRGSQGSADGYFGLSSASSSECDDHAFKQPPTPATPLGAPPGLGGDRKRMMIGVLNAAEKRKSTFM